MLELSKLSPPPGSKKNRKRIGRGAGSGLGEQSGRGHKGQKARSGGKVPAYFEGGQMPLIRILPKRGFRNANKIRYQIVNVGSLEKLDSGEVTPKTLKKAGLIATLSQPVKALGNGEIKKALMLKGISVSETAMQKITAAGGKVEK